MLIFFFFFFFFVVVVAADLALIGIKRWCSNFQTPPSFPRGQLFWDLPLLDGNTS